MLAQNGAKNSERSKDQADKYAKRQQDGRNHPADSASSGKRAPVGIHRTGVHLPEVAVTHDPGENAERGTSNKTQNSKDENERAAVWFHKRYLAAFAINQRKGLGKRQIPMGIGGRAESAAAESAQEKVFAREAAGNQNSVDGMTTKEQVLHHSGLVVPRDIDWGRECQFQSSCGVVIDVTRNPVQRGFMKARIDARYEYKFVRLGEGWLAAKSEARNRYQEEILQHAREGWRLVQIFAPGVGAYGAAKYYELILERKVSD